MSLGNESYEFHVIALGKYSVAFSEKCISCVYGVCISIEGIDGWLTVSLHVLILYIIVNE